MGRELLGRLLENSFMQSCLVCCKIDDSVNMYQLCVLGENVLARVIPILIRVSAVALI